MLIKTINYYENTKYTLKKGNQKLIVMCLSSSRKCRIFSAQLKCTANGISVQNMNVLPNLWSHFGNFSLHMAQSLEVSNIRGKNKKNFEKFPLFIIDNQHVSKFFLFFPLIF